MPNGTAILGGQLSLSVASVEIWHFDLCESQQRVLRQDDSYRLDLSLNPRIEESGLCFADRWPAHRYQRGGKLFLLPPSETMRIRTGVGQQHVIICHLPTDQISNWLGSDVEWTDGQLEASLNIASVPMETLLLQLGEEARHPGFASEILCEAMAAQIAVHLARFYRDIPDVPVSGGLAPWRLRLIDERLRDDHTAPTLAELATLCKLSVRQLSRGFRESQGISIGEHVARERIEHAKQMLRANESVKSVSYALGFASPSSFSYAFRKATGIAPSDFRTRH